MSLFWRGVFDIGQWIIIYFLFINFVYIVLLALSVLEIIRRRYLADLHEAEFVDERYYIPITIIAPAFNEEATIEGSVRAMLGLNYPNHDLIVVNDGSSDGTLAVLIKAFKLTEITYPVYQELKTSPVRKAAPLKTGRCSCGSKGDAALAKLWRATT